MEIKQAIGAVAFKMAAEYKRKSAELRNRLQKDGKVGSERRSVTFVLASLISVPPVSSSQQFVVIFVESFGCLASRTKKRERGN